MAEKQPYLCGPKFKMSEPTVKNSIAADASPDSIFQSLLDNTDVNYLTTMFGLESNLAILMAVNRLEDAQSGKTFHDNIQLLNIDCLQFQIELDEDCVNEAAEFESSAEFTNDEFKEEFVRLINCNKTKMKICPTVEAKFNDPPETDGDNDDVTTIDDGVLIIDEGDSNKNVSAQTNFIVGNNVSVGSGAKFDDNGIVKMTTAFPYEKPVQRMFEVLESVYIISNLEKRRCFLCLRLSSSYAVISCSIAKIFRNNQSLHDRYVCRRCYDSVKSFLINAEKRMLRNEPLTEIKGTQINYKNCCNKFLTETEVPSSVDIGKLDVEAKSFRFRVERDFPILRQQMKFFKKYMVESILPIFRHRLKNFRTSNSSIIAIGKYFACVVSVFDFINDTLVSGINVFKSFSDIKREIQRSRSNTSSEMFRQMSGLIDENPLRPFKPQKEKLDEIEIKPEDVVFCQTNSTLIWKRAKIAQVSYKNRTAMITWLDDKVKNLMDMKHFHQIAYSFIYPSQLQVGERTISNMYQKESDKDVFMSGYILETLSDVNRNRYLILFDNGEARYVYHYFVRKVLVTASVSCSESSQKMFLDTYFQLYPKKKNIHRTNRKLFYVEHNFEWEKAKIIHYDGSLVYLEHLNCKKMEWVSITSNRITSNDKIAFSDVNYRREILESGTVFRRNLTYSSYLDEVYKVTSPNGQNAANNRNSISAQTNSRRRSTRNGNYGRKSNDDDDEGDDDDEEDDDKNGDDDEDADFDFGDDEDDSDVDYVGSKAAGSRYSNVHEPLIVINEGNEQKNDVTKKFLNRNCVCCEPKKNSRLKTLNPLRLPESYGWKRLILTKSADNEYICYQTPCGELVYDLEVLYRHLLDTKSPLSIENFSFDTEVNWVREVTEEPDKILIKNDDLSFGKEEIPISVINTINYQCPTDFSYIVGRRPTKDIHLDTDPGFMVCCDCVDDCSDNTRCQCRALTIQEAEVTIRAMDDDDITLNDVGYKYMRLENEIKCGIYECNKNCKCSKKCLNRVIQLPFRQALQLHMTEERGWGVRATYDIPQGTFICRYGGFIMTDDEANNEGIIFGDEYFADLDYIEVVEAIKEGYEDDVEDIEDDDISKNNEEPPHKKMKTDQKADRRSDKPSQTRELFKDGHSEMYIMDAKGNGNIGRYFNHSCEPNLFVQNVFTDTHDIRFPWVCFFTSRTIVAGEELTWDYNYTPGSVPGRKIDCACGAETCRKRLL